MVVGVLATIAAAIPATAAAAPPAITLENQTSAQGLLGTKQTVTLVAKNPETQPRGYNLTFRVVLPPGVVYAGGASPSVTVANKPTTGKTTLLFENVSDLSPKSGYTLSFEVEPKSETFKLAGSKYPIEAESFISEKPRRKPVFEKSGTKEGQWAETPVEVEKINRVKANSETELTAIEILKSEPSPEGEILRGVHEHQTVYTLTVKNNHVGPTEGLTGQGAAGKLNKSIIVEDWVPAGLEFLGCGKTDNTSNTKTNPGSREEYAGSGLIDPGNAPTIEGCIEPFYVKTEKTDPPSKKLPEGVYTHVKWEGPASMVASGEFKIQYVAAVPILKNSTTWLGAEPAPEATAEGGGAKQIANLNNNTGAETVDEEPLINNAQARGKYEGVEVKDEDELKRTAEDLAAQKSVDKPGISDGQISTWTMKIESSEYRYVNNVRVDDTLPNGLCPLGPKNYETTPPTALAECDKVAGTEPSFPYTNVEEQKNGSFKIHWDQTTDAQLAQMPPSTTVEIKFPTRNRVFYQENFESQTSRPILTKDSWENEVKVAGADYARCAPGNPTCATEPRNEIFHEEEDGIDDFDESSAKQEAGGIEIQKTVRKNLEEAPGECKDESGHYVKGLLSAEAALPKYRPGDQICWRLRVEFSSNVYAGTPTVSDFIPTDEEYVPSSVVEGPSNNVESTFKNEEEVLEWTLGNSVATSKLFEVRFRTKVGATTTSNPGDISGNLMKVTYSNKEGTTFPLRDRAEVERQEPNLELKKKVLAVNGGAASTTVKGGDKVKFGIELPNTTGTLKAEEIEVWDELPTGLECGVNVTEISNNGECASTKRIVWKPSLENISVEAGKTGGPLTYVATIPSDVAPGHEYKNTAGVVNFKSKTNTGGQFTYIPEQNINPSAGTANTGPAKATAAVTTSGATVTKAATTETTQEGNNASQATIGETVKYTVTAKVPKNSVLYETATLRDEIPAGLELLPSKGQATLKLGAEESPAGFTVTEIKEGAKVVLQVNFPERFTTGATESEVVLTFKAKVKNIAANVQGTTIENRAKLAFHDKEGASRSAETKEATKTPVVEPELLVAKTQSAEVVKPGDKVTYTVSAEDAALHSAANSVVLVDNVPLGMQIVGTETEGGVYEPTARTITWTIGTVNPGQKVTRTYKLEVENPAKAASVFTNKVTGTTQSMPPGEGAPGRTASFEEGTYKAKEKGYESSATKTSHLTGTEITKTVEPTEGTIGTPLKYTLKLKLLPGIKYFNTTIVDTLPDGVAYDRTIATRIVEPEGAPEITNAATTVTAKPEGTPERFAWYFGSVPTESNPSTSHLRELIVEFEGHIKGERSAGTKILAGATLTNSVTGLYNGEKGTKPATVPDPTVNHGGFGEATPPATARTTVNEPNLTIAKSVEVKEAGGGNGPEVQPGSTFTYKLLVTNSSEWAAHNVEITDTNPQADLRELTPVPQAGVKVLSTGPLRWEIATVAKNTPVTLEYTAKLAPSKELENGDAIDNTAAIPSYYGVPLNEQQPGVEYRKYVGNESSVDLNVALPNIVLHKSAGPKEKHSEGALIGEPFQWNLKVENTSASAEAKSVDLLDRLPANWEYVKGSAKLNGAAYYDPTSETNTALGEEANLLWEGVTDLKAKASATLTFEAIPTTALINHEETFTNHAIATGKDVSGEPGSRKGAYESKSEAEATLTTPPLKIEKTPDENEPAAKVIAGNEAAYTITVTNTGSAKATGVKVSDLLDQGNVYTPGPTTGATAVPGAGFGEVGTPKQVTVGGETKTEVTWGITEIPAGKAVVITVPVKVESKVKDGTKLHDVATVTSQQQPEPTSHDQGTLEISRVADLGIIKNQVAPALSAKGVPGETVEYNLHVENFGPSDAEEVVVRDPIPTGTEFVSADSPCVLVGNEVVCELPGELPANEAANYKVKLKILSSTTTTVVNKAKVSTTTKEPKGGGEPNESTATTPVEPKDSLTVVKRGPGQPVLLGSTFEYELEVTNAGPSDAAGVVVTDPLPAQEELVEAAAPCEESETEPGVVKCSIPSIAAGAPAVKLHFKVKAIGIPAEGKVKNVATVSSSTEDINVNNTGTAETEVLPAADLSIVKTAPATVEPNGELTYKLHVENHGPSIAHKVTVTDPLPAGVVFVAASEGCANAALTVTCTVQPSGELAVGASADFTVTVQVPFALGSAPLVNTATVKGEEGDPNTENDQSTVTTTVGPAADLAITKTMGKAEAGKPLIYTLAVTNKGPSASSAVTVKDTLPAGTTFKSAAPSQGTCSSSGQEVTCQLGGLASGGAAQVSITVEVGATVTGTLKNTAKVEGPEPDPDKSNNESSVEGPVTPAPPTPASAPNLRVVKTASTSAPQVGTPFSYTVAVSNLSGAEAKNVKVVDTLNGPVKVESIEAESGKCSSSGSKIECSIPSIPVGKTVKITYSVVAEAAGPLSNTASAQASNGEVAPANNHAVKSVRAKAGKAAKASYTLTKTAAKKVVEGGKTVRFTITLRNGPTALVDAKVCDRLPAALVFVRAAGASFVKGEACWQEKYVAAHKTLKLHLTARAVRGFMPRKARNVASASAENAPGAKHASATVRIKPAFAGAPGGVTG